MSFSWDVCNPSNCDFGPESSSILLLNVLKIWRWDALYEQVEQSCEPLLFATESCALALHSFYVAPLFPALVMIMIGEHFQKLSNRKHKLIRLELDFYYSI